MPSLITDSSLLKKPRFLKTRQLLELLELVSDSLKRRSDLFDETVISKVLDLEEGLMNLTPPQNEPNQLKAYQNVYQGIKSAIKHLGSLGSALSDVGVSFIFPASNPKLTTWYGVSGESRRPTKCSSS